MNKKQILAAIQERYSPEQYLRAVAALDFAEQHHKGQKRKSGENYIIHPIAVAGILVEWDLDIDTILAGFLHDTVEDTDATLRDIKQQFGKDVAFLVDGVTKLSQTRSGMRNLDSYLPQTKDNLSKLLIAVGQDIRVIIIKLADRLHNMQTLQHMSPDKQQKIARETLDVFAPLADRLNMGRVRVQLEELSFSYLEPKEYKHLKKLMKDRLGKSHKKLVHARTEIDARLDAESIHHLIDGRIKSVYSLYKKLKKVGSIDECYDLIALRVIVNTKEDCYRTLGIIHSLYQPMVNRIKDYIATPKPNGYQSLHTTVITPDQQIIEFQIRTNAMHTYAERGLAASFAYNEQKHDKSYQQNKSTSSLPKHLEWIQGLQAVAAQLRSGENVALDQLKIDLFSDRIFVYSPKGDIYNLPEGALPLDFAYLVHSDVARRAVGFKVNNHMVSFSQPLQNGDVVEILTRRFSNAKQDWLELVTTTHAKSKLRTQLKKDLPLG